MSATTVDACPLMADGATEVAGESISESREEDGDKTADVVAEDVDG